DLEGEHPGASGGTQPFCPDALDLFPHWAKEGHGASREQPFGCEFLDRFDELGDATTTGNRANENDFLDLLVRWSSRWLSCRRLAGQTGLEYGLQRPGESSEAVRFDRIGCNQGVGKCERLALECIGDKNSQAQWPILGCGEARMARRV